MIEEDSVFEIAAKVVSGMPDWVFRVERQMELEYLERQRRRNEKMLSPEGLEIRRKQLQIEAGLSLSREGAVKVNISAEAMLKLFALVDVSSTYHNAVVVKLLEDTINAEYSKLVEEIYENKAL